MTFGFPAEGCGDGQRISPALSTDLFGSATIITPPSPSGLSGIALAVQPVIQLNNIYGATDLLYVGSVTVTASGAGTLSGTATVAVVAGLATFVGLTLTGAGTTTLTFSATGRGRVTSGTITIT